MSARLQNIAIYGAAGNIGTHITRALLASPHRPATITAIARESSTSSFPDGVVLRRADTDSVGALAKALHGVDLLILGVGHEAGPALSTRLIDAAAQAGVRFVLPSEFGSDTAHPVIEENPINGSKRAAREHVAHRGMKWIAVASNAWYEFCLPTGFFGIDAKKREARLYDDGNTPNLFSTMPFVGRAVAAVATLPVSAPPGQPSLEGYANGHVYVADLRTTQNEMLAAVQRATGSKAADWSVSRTPSKPAFEELSKRTKEGDKGAMFQLLFLTCLASGFGGQFEGKVLDNEKLGLGFTDLDEATRVALS